MQKLNTYRVSRRLKFAGIAIALGLAGILIWQLVGQQEPAYQGRTISSWLDEVTFAGADNQRFYKASVAIGRIGPPGIPFIIHRLESDDQVSRNPYRLAWPNLPDWLRKVLPRPKQPLSESANNVLAWAGPGGVPQLIHALEHTNATVRAQAACSLGMLRKATPEVVQAIPGLIDVLGDTRGSVAIEAALALGMMGVDASNAVPALTATLQNAPNSTLRRNAARALGRIGPAAGSAAPSLTPLLASQDRFLPAQAAMAIWRITGETDTTLPILTEELRQAQATQWNAVQAELIDALGEMGPKAISALPLISADLNHPMRWVRERATNAVRRISPADSAGRVGE